MVAPTGRRLGRYHLVEPIGTGPCGEVFRAKVLGVAGMERQFAIKRFYPAVLARPEALARLQQATRAYGGLDHPRIARLAELGVAAGETFTATELVPGLDLARLVAMERDRIPAGAGLGFVSAAARAMGYAHGRGVTHGGLCPTNLIATLEGDVKVTDVGVLGCRLGPRPAVDEALLGRLPYLAPEQLLGETVAAAADVFALGVIAYELVSGVRPFGGATTLEIEHAIVSGRPAPLELPRPVARVIDRCLARSPFERFPDARALADALDAALRLSPLVGGRLDLGQRVRAATEHLTRLNEQQLSGALSFTPPSGGPPVRSTVGALPLPPPRSVPATPPPATPIPAPPPTPRSRPFRPSVAPPLQAPPTEPGDEITRARVPNQRELSVGDETAPRIEPLWPPTEPVKLLRTTDLAAPPPPPLPRVAPTSSHPPHASLPTLQRARPQSSHPPMTSGLPPPPPLVVASPPSRRRGLVIALTAMVLGGGAAAAYMLTRPGASDATAVATAPSDAARSIDAGAIGVTATLPIDAPTASADAPTATADAATANASADAGISLDAGAPSDATPTPTPTPTADKLVIAATPPGARVFLDGAELGVAPATLPASADRHALAIFAPGHELYLATIDGSGRHDATLSPVAPRTGRGGIKVRCKAGGRYYVFIDGAGTGELCPTERIPVDLGTHTIEIYDLVTESRRSATLRVTKIARSTRIKMD